MMQPTGSREMVFGSESGGGIPTTAAVITVDDESATLTNSRQVNVLPPVFITAPSYTITKANLPTLNCFETGGQDIIFDSSQLPNGATFYLHSGSNPNCTLSLAQPEDFIIGPKYLQAGDILLVNMLRASPESEAQFDVTRIRNGIDIVQISSGVITAPAGSPYPFIFNFWQPPEYNENDGGVFAQITEIGAICSAGSCTVNFQLNGAPTDMPMTVNASTSGNINNGGGLPFAEINQGDSLTFTPSSISSCENLLVYIKVTYEN